MRYFLKISMLIFIAAFSLHAQGIGGKTGIGGSAGIGGGSVAVNVPVFQKFAAGGNSAVSSIPAVFSGNVTNGDTIPCFVYWVDASATLTGFSKTAGTSTTGSFTTIDTLTANTTSHVADAWASVTGTGTLTVTATFSTTITGVATIICHDVTNITATAPVDGHTAQSQPGPGLGTNAVTSGSITTGSSGDYIFGFNIDIQNNVTSFTAGTGFTIRENDVNITSEDQVQSSAGSIAATFTWNTSGGGDTAMTGVLALKHS